jgi:dolichol-phosphate mannosyltransferase
MFSLVVPCRNEEQVLSQVFERLTAAARDWHDDYEVLLVDDGSQDATWAMIERFHRRDPRWKGIALARNFGQQAAIGAGLRHAAGDAIVVLDADLQDPPEVIVRMLEKWHEGYDVVYGIRTSRPESLLKRCCYALFYRLLACSSPVELPRDAGDFCLMDRRVVDVLRSFEEQHPFWRGLRCWSGFRQIGVPYERQVRQAGRSQYSFRKLLRLASDGLFSLSSAPLQVVTWLGAVATPLVLVVGVILLGLGQVSSTPTALLWAGLFLGGVQLLCLGTLAAYLGRIYDEVRRRPRWVIASTLGIASSTELRPPLNSECAWSARAG